jgi:hypothetical protein
LEGYVGLPVGRVAITIGVATVARDTAGEDEASRRSSQRGGCMTLEA